MANTKDLVRKYNIRFTKSLGQNFLVDETVVKRIVDAAEISGNDLVIEVGPGIGSMTGELASRAGKVIAVEIDKHLIPALQENLKGYSNVVIMNDDIMKLELKELFTKHAKDENGQDYCIKVVANLPYYITTPIIMKFLEDDAGIESMVFMIQKEVAERMAAKPGGKDYGALSVAVQYYSVPKVVLNVSPHCFIPQPEVDSTVVKLTVNKVPPVELLDKDLFFRVIKASFGQRRKTLVNALCNSGYFIKSKDEVKEILKKIGIGENQRGETLSIMQFASLANSFFDKK
ncbi:MAG TPA: 16S rRNA (adenine(1518)-N(6)/adenine(1519)-N(6))-dimethyltransferase RsmA [Clostridia bacterium]|nr:16S rRNA (adenine(1518)-N(6)/adenine(1519)-N(6))-dimethyltransferase RsmA [Clostridia bacterium]